MGRTLGCNTNALHTGNLVFHPYGGGLIMMGSVALGFNDYAYALPLTAADACTTV
ncbi:MAG TPA: hypothetical protein VJO35_02355 [Terriglobales bacterium]|nr:hypothetical protein [Terriglobales bacterium]